MLYSNIVCLSRYIWNRIQWEINFCEVERMERELNSARKKLERVHQRRYQTDSEAETDAQSG